VTTANSNRVRVGLLAYGLDRPNTGIARYTIELATALAETQADIELVLLQPFAGEIAGLRGIECARLRTVRLLPGLMAFGPVELAITARRRRLDVIHDPAGVAPFLMTRSTGGCATITTIHDMAPFVYPETHVRLTNLLFKQYMPRTLRFVDRIVTVSDSSRRDMERFYGLMDDRVVRISCGVNRRFRPQPASEIQRVVEKYGLPPRYILSVGALNARKNIETALSAFAVLRSNGIEHELVLVGPKSWKSQGIFERITSLGIEDAVRFTGFVDDEDLPAVYSGAACFVYPSLYEGFGLPPLEAMACGTPVVASNASSIPEVTGNAAVLVPPTDVEGFAHAVQLVLTNPERSEHYRRAGLAQAACFSWDRAASAHADLYRELAAARNGRAA
jgi:glycosyltransferase involved in cell wall biosynthesis